MPNDTDLQKLIDQINIYHPQADFDQISKAYNFAKEAHEGQKRRDGQPYFVHPLSVAFTLARLQLDDSSIIASLLHDVVEDTRYSVKKIELNFGKEVAFLVEGVTKLKKLKYRLGRKEYFSENLKKMFVAMAKDIRVVLIKLADRLHNMETIGYVSQEERDRKAYEVMEIYAPLAQRLGIGEIRDRLEDIAFQYIYPEEHKWVKEISAEHYIEADKYLQKVKTVLQKSLREQGIEAEIDARAKHLYSLYKKLLRKDKDINKIYDLVALRVIVNTISECYETLGMIHKQWFPLLGMIKDYISLPKPNGYRSLHTTVFCLEGRITEFQIRTWQMHYEAEHGVAAHWYYADKKKSLIVDEIGLKKGFKVPGEILKWVEELPKWQKELTQGEDLLNTLRIDTLEDRIFVFTPHGDVVDLPVGATAIDFAYAIHTLVGDRCLGAKVNGKLAELSLELKNGDIVEILRSKNERKPKRDWLNFVKTTRAKTAIKKSLSL
ncbi:hypothetical protein A2X44_03625 [candidate division CPR3 bacterium GWF2_35_18]|uniref:(P)ppGpp synthetase I, SpoT/RelA n=1 Tax=candidate division CPR3 bacterium GW2011_GWF2_35_18 TaxID=1618350 RepID=A0A0G0EQM8_UNCC3|nr:MAG: (P)ppGpp synthetase I, SpoT/RelA [candidate division CPR3 bacterium GW2011_GWF2_35_18]KKP87080.1 MAG: (P)ppGpp synthetase I, SpoT/RelA [candidate division CPR3 bacterium GW2011_GWE2_35_7]OGB63103.1 MAG: hypothetical protein A2X44_03625 [candidate division CPR3 bacterium GWF2_35_18]OGB64083.1 MAG: hypothetical protein A2250_04765 [candidate division CPR3 bacterium RIFOXYA2_FULL_35_13]OGB78896.1 MAG: hypothetical protein A2296_04825 [candidate division CPR3 bacterium RIFOXYB2_FULL_35_8]O